MHNTINYNKKQLIKNNSPITDNNNNVENKSNWFKLLIWKIFDKISQKAVDKFFEFIKKLFKKRK